MNQRVSRFSHFWRRPQILRRRARACRGLRPLQCPFLMDWTVDTHPCQILDPPLTLVQCMRFLHATLTSAGVPRPELNVRTKIDKTPIVFKLCLFTGFSIIYYAESCISYDPVVRLFVQHTLELSQNDAREDQEIITDG